MEDRLYGLIGRKLGHSYSVAIHRELGNCNYSLFELEPEQLDDFFRRDDIGGLNVTIPYKLEVMKYCDVLSPVAQAIGSVNTIVRKSDGLLYGFNTDAYGFEFQVKLSGIDFKGKKTVVLGSGGASLTVAYVAKKLGASEVVVVSRNGENNYDNLNRHSNAEIVVNATPVGMYPAVGRAPVDLHVFTKCEGAIELIFNPARTAFLMQADELGISNINGLPMLVAQAKAAEELFFGINIDDSENLKTYEKLRRETDNIVLIGMPGCGKSTVGAALAKITGRDLIDTDAEIEKITGCTISDIFAKNGEDGFRELEREMIAKLGLLTGKIISVGGGAVKDERNYIPLRQNGRVYYLERDLSLLSRDGRPLSQGTNLSEMYSERLTAYLRFRDVCVETRLTPEDTAAVIWREFNENISDKRA
ncbi:MAG: shikimate kinase [Firmicutes bacterium HGW-Firmicutes-16]|nr:MAG: shikimate kinase [Firmicutes bacterium HGW-Firmicutes-16]